MVANHLSIQQLEENNTPEREINEKFPTEKKLLLDEIYLLNDQALHTFPESVIVSSISNSTAVTYSLAGKAP